MATLFNTKNKSYIVQLSPGENKKRPKIALGKCTLKHARESRNYIESLVRGETKAAIQEWVEKLPDGLRTRLERLGLVKPCNGSRWTIAAFVADYIKRRTDVKGATRRKWKDVERKLNVFFRGDNIGDITVQQAKNFRVYLQTICKLQENTIRRHIGIARQFFNAAVDAELIKRNPFRGQPVSVRANETRFFYVTPEMAQKVLNACPDSQWRLIFGLARFGGLRCPSEVLRLKWQDVDFEHNHFTVHATKTEHHTDGGIRIVPMFPELKPLFQDAFDEAKDGAVYCIEKTRDNTVNLRTHMMRIIRRAGLEPWPKLFQNCRSTRETELFRMTGGNVKAVCEWIGNSPQVAMTHYAQVTEADMKEAARMMVLNDAEERVHNTVHPMNESECKPVQGESQDVDVTRDDCSMLQSFATSCTSGQDTSHWAVQDSNKKPQGVQNKELTQTSQGQRVHNTVHSPNFSPELQGIIDRWDGLPEHIKAAIKALIQTHSMEAR